RMSAGATSVRPPNFPPAIRMILRCTALLTVPNRLANVPRKLEQPPPGSSIYMTKKTQVRVYLTFFVFVLAAISYLDRTNISIAGVQLMPEFGISNQELGYILSAFLAGYGLFQIPAGWLARK